MKVSYDLRFQGCGVVVFVSLIIILVGQCHGNDQSKGDK